MRRHLSIGFLALAVVCCLAPATHAATCGKRDPKTHQIALGQLTLNPASRTDVAYKRDKDPRSILLVFDVKGCTLDGTHQPAPEVVITPTTSPGKDLPEDALTPPSGQRRGESEVEYRFAIDSGKLDPGSYFGAVELTASDIRTTRTPISISRSENRLRVPAIFGALGGLAGMAWFLIVSYASSSLPTGQKGWWAVLLLVLGALFGGIAGYLFWTNQDVWTRGDNGWATIVAGFTGATTGALAALTTQLVKYHSADAAALRNASTERTMTRRPATPGGAAELGDDGF
jgi:hypothetical protein